MLHLNNSGYTRQDAPSILRRARTLTGPDVTVRDVRVASGHIELDITIPDDLLSSTVASLVPVGSLRDARLVVEEAVPKDTAMAQGIEYFNGERFWECHESLEGVWKECYEGEKDLVQGVILVAAGLVHYQKNRDDICLSIFGRAQRKLSTCTGMYYDIDVDSLRDRLDHMMRTGTISTFDLA